MTMLPRIAEIQRAVAEHYGTSTHAMCEPVPKSANGSNARPVSHPRQVAMALSFLLTEHSRMRIGYFFGGRDPTTVNHACRVVEKRRAGDPVLHNTMRRLTLELVR